MREQTQRDKMEKTEREREHNGQNLSNASNHIDRILIYPPATNANDISNYLNTNVHQIEYRFSNDWVEKVKSIFDVDLFINFTFHWANTKQPLSRLLFSIVFIQR